MSHTLFLTFVSLLCLLGVIGCRSEPSSSEPAAPNEAAPQEAAQAALSSEPGPEVAPALPPLEPASESLPQLPSALSLDAFPELPQAARQLGLDLEVELAALDQRFGPHVAKENPKRPGAQWLEWRGVALDDCAKTDLNLSQEGGKFVFMAVELGPCRATMEKLVNALGGDGCQEG